ncbi:alkaline phosphatase D family protein [Pinirhizobacter soli]|uniref:alkaline phosphatase D family protein n=1 Tax=Pinirhizobacter soli TaxID=2786953 RepID=UPI00202A2A3E|nr:alkaline phosphatase D family protein [Pinirhizobacter soli]
MQLTRRQFLAMAAAFGAAAIVGTPLHARSRVPWRERRDLYPEGVASGDPTADGVMLWTRYPLKDPGKVAALNVEVAEDPAFQRVVAHGVARVSSAADWTCRALIGGLKPAHEYWYRFTDAEGNGSRVGRTLTAPAEGDNRPVRFAFISCQNANFGAQNAYRRMIFEDERAAPGDRLGFVLHLGDFIYEIVWYPEDRSKGMYDRRIRDIVRYAHGEKIADFHIPTTVDDYRAVYHAYLHDPDIQDARARFPFVAMWDNHEFSWQGWQSQQRFDGKNYARQTRKVAANQAWFEVHPARIKTPSGSRDQFNPPRVVDTPIDHFDDAGMGQEPNNLAALASLTGYRTLRWGANVDLIITDQRSYRSEDPLDLAEADAFTAKEFPQLVPQEAQEILDAGRSYNQGKPPATIRWGDQDLPNFTRDKPRKVILGATQQAWFLQQLKASKATWKIWGNTTATLDMRADPQNLPTGLTKPWPGAGYAGFGGGDHSSAYVERAEIYDFVEREGITGFATVAGDRHSFWAGLAAKALPPQKFEPVGVAFVVGSISAPGMVEAMEHNFAKEHPLRPLFLADNAGTAKPGPAVNMLLHHGVRSCLEYAKSADMAKARAASNPDNAPHVSFVDMGGHGYAVVKASRDALETEFVCIQRPIERASGNDGGPLRYRVVHRTPAWKKGERPKMEQRMLEGDAPFSV